MIGAVLIAIALVVVMPVMFWVGIGVVSAVLGGSLKEHAEATHEGSDLIATNI